MRAKSEYCKLFCVGIKAIEVFCAFKITYQTVRYHYNIRARCNFDIPVI